MTEIIIRLKTPKNSSLIFIDIDGDAKEVFDNKQDLIKYLQNIL